MDRGPTGARKAVPFLIASVASKPIGFLKEMLVAALYGSGVPRDAFLVAWQIPNLAGSLILEGLPQVLVPYVADLQKRERRGQILGGLLGLLAAGFAALGLAIWLAAPALVRVVAPFAGLETRELATSLLRILAFSVALMGASSVFTGLLFARQKFVAATLAVPVMNVVVMGVVLLGHRTHGIHALAWGTLLGTAAMALVLVRGAFGLSPRRPATLAYGEYREFFALLSAFFLGTLLFNANALVEKIFASTLPPGGISNLDYAFRLVQMIFTLLAVIPTFLFPRLCDLAAEEGGWDGFRTLLAKGAHATILLALPVSAVVWGLRRPLIEIVYQRGAFDRATAAATADLLGFYSLGIAAHAFNNLLVHVFYARREMRVRIGYGVVFLAANTGVNLLLVGRLGAPAIALANTVAAWVCSMYLLVLLHRRLPAPIARFVPVLWKSALTAFVLAAAVAVVERVVPGHPVLRLALAAALAAGGFLALVQWLRIEGAVYLWDLLKMARAR